MILLKAVDKNIFIHSNIDVFMISDLQIIQITKKEF